MKRNLKPAAVLLTALFMSYGNYREISAEENELCSITEFILMEGVYSDTLDYNADGSVNVFDMMRYKESLLNTEPGISDPVTEPEPEHPVTVADPETYDWGKYGGLCKAAINYAARDGKINLEALNDCFMRGRTREKLNSDDSYEPVFSEELITFEGYTENPDSELNRILITPEGIMYTGLKSGYSGAVLYYTPFEKSEDGIYVECSDYRTDSPSVKFTPDAVSIITRYIRGDITPEDDRVTRYMLSPETALSFGDDFSKYLDAVNSGEADSSASFDGIPERLEELTDISGRKNGIKIIESTVTENPCFKDNKTINVKGLMLHSVGQAMPWAQYWVEKFNSDFSRSVCVHAFIDAKNGDIYQTLPWEHRGWHAGGTANNSYIGVEMCESDRMIYRNYTEITCEDADAVRKDAETAYNSAVKLFALLCRQYNLNPVTDIISHNEGGLSGIASKHVDPEHYWKGIGVPYTMNGFRNDVKTAMENEIQTETGSAYKFIGYDNWAPADYPVKTAAPAVPGNSTGLKSIDEIAREVIGGLWGTGSERKSRLTSAGYDYDAVQKRVAELLR